MSIQWQRPNNIGYPLSQGGRHRKGDHQPPEKRNAFRPQTVTEMCDAFADARDDQAIGVCSSPGPVRTPTASMPSARAATRVCAAVRLCREDGVPRLNVLELQKLIRSMPKVVIALVAGYAIGGATCFTWCAI